MRKDCLKLVHTQLLLLKQVLRQPVLLDFSKPRLFRLCGLSVLQFFNLALHYPFARLFEASGLGYRTKILARYLAGPFLLLVIHATALIQLVERFVYTAKFGSGATEFYSPVGRCHILYILR